MAGGRETIFALATPPGRAGIAVIRVSGPDTAAALERLTGGPPPPPRQACLTNFTHPGSGESIDRGLLLWFPGPASYSGEDLAELQLHGGRAVVAGMVEALGSLTGLRPAEPGEFTRRAFDNGKLDLVEVEALADLIDAETEAQRRQALGQLGGALSRLAADWRGRLLRALAHVEAEIDFPDEEAVPGELAAPARAEAAAVAAEIAAALDDARRGERLRDGLMVAILGAPNVGKSSLLNALARRDAAIVAATAGTTRDVIEVHLDLDGLPVTLADTAGLRAADQEGALDPVEVEGIRRSRGRVAAADLKLAVFDLDGWPALDAETRQLVDAGTLVVLNKCDLVAPAELAGIVEDFEGGTIAPAERAAIAVSATEGSGLETLVARLRELAAERLGLGGGAAVITRARQRAALEDCRAALLRTWEGDSGRESALLAEDLRLALRALGRLAGRVDVEDLLDVVFRDFCLGK